MPGDPIEPDPEAETTGLRKTSEEAIRLAREHPEVFPKPLSPEVVEALRVVRDHPEMFPKTTLMPKMVEAFQKVRTRPRSRIAEALDKISGSEPFLIAPGESDAVERRFGETQQGIAQAQALITRAREDNDRERTLPAPSDVATAIRDGIDKLLTVNQASLDVAKSSATNAKDAYDLSAKSDRRLGRLTAFLVFLTIVLVAGPLWHDWIVPAYEWIAGFVAGLRS